MIKCTSTVSNQAPQINEVIAQCLEIKGPPSCYSYQYILCEIRFVHFYLFICANSRKLLRGKIKLPRHEMLSIEHSFLRERNKANIIFYTSSLAYLFINEIKIGDVLASFITFRHFDIIRCLNSRNEDKHFF